MQVFRCLNALKEAKNYTKMLAQHGLRGNNHKGITTRWKYEFGLFQPYA